MPKSGFALSVSRVGDEVTLAVSGKLDAVSHARLRRAVEDACRSTPAPVTVYLDLTDLDGIDDPVVALLAATAEMCAELGVQLRPSFAEASRKIVEAAGYDDLLRPIRPPG